ncbi:MAG TPA: polysaccharide biosynthesis/export family protein [Caulobacteraceae bacterium]|nr:polysaccharide biosynthesis/export family protein [Caulobacteraceae bacterium]
MKPASPVPGEQGSCSSARSRRGLAVCLLASLAVAGCSTIPEDGPSGRAVSAQAKTANARYALVDVDYRVAQTINQVAPPAPLATLRDSPAAAPSDLIAVGDTLAISIFQPTFSPTGLPDPNPTANAGVETLPRVVVDRSGAVSVPFAGTIDVANLTPEGAAAAIRLALRGKFANPQVTVTSVASPRNSVIVIGEVRNPGRFPLTASSDRVLDALAAAGGPTKPPRDLTLTVVRGDNSATIAVNTLLDDPAENVRLAPLDQIRVLPAPRKITVFGSVTKSNEVPFVDDTLTLAGALARIGGLNGQLSNAKSVLVFRIERLEVARALGVSFPDQPGLKGVPIIYRVNLKDPAGYFYAGKFEMAADDLVYVPTADAAELQKFLLIVNSAAQFFYDAAVAKSL